MPLRQTGRRAIAAGISTRVKFTHGNVSGKSYSNGLRVLTGRLPREHATALKAITEAVYVVKSYATPIAWYTETQGWTVPDVKFSATTNHHQAAVRMAVR